MSIKLSENLKTEFNGKLHLVADLDVTSQYIGSGDTLEEAKADALRTKIFLLEHNESEEPEKSDDEAHTDWVERMQDGPEAKGE